MDQEIIYKIFSTSFVTFLLGLIFAFGPVGWAFYCDDESTASKIYTFITFSATVVSLLISIISGIIYLIIKH